jgi:soluble lytic murein transglycosylase
VTRARRDAGRARAPRAPASGAREQRPRGSGASGTARAKRDLWLVACAVVALAIAAITQAPKVARQVWHILGVRRVESRAEEIRAAAAESRLDPCLLAAIMYVESRGQIDAVSSAGALGLFQLTPSAAADAARRLHIDEPSREALLSDAALSARLAANHIAWLVENEGPDLERVLVAYNVGRGKLARWSKEAGGYDAWRAERARAGAFGPLVYAEQVLDFRERFRARGVVTPAAPPTADAEAPATR